MRWWPSGSNVPAGGRASVRPSVYMTMPSFGSGPRHTSRRSSSGAMPSGKLVRGEPMLVPSDRRSGGGCPAVQ